MNRHYSLFSSPSSRAKARRENFASTRNSLSESWEQTLSENAPFTALPSPTIGEESGIPERLSLALSPLARARVEHHHQSHQQQQTHPSHHHHHSYFSSMMTSSPTPTAATGGSSANNTTATATKASSLSSTTAFSGSCSSSSVGASSTALQSTTSKVGQQHKPLPKWSPRLQIVRQLSQPVLRTAEIIDTTRQQRTSVPLSSSTSCTTSSANVLTSSSNSSANTATSKRYLSKHHSASSAGLPDDDDWNKDVSTQCDIFKVRENIFFLLWLHAYMLYTHQIYFLLNQELYQNCFPARVEKILFCSLVLSSSLAHKYLMLVHVAIIQQSAYSNPAPPLHFPSIFHSLSPSSLTFFFAFPNFPFLLPYI